MPYPTTRIGSLPPAKRTELLDTIAARHAHDVLTVEYEQVRGTSATPDKVTGRILGLAYNPSGTLTHHLIVEPAGTPHHQPGTRIHTISAATLVRIYHPRSSGGTTIAGPARTQES